jgi:glucose-1-phosphate thymidylyltransferase
VEEYGDQRDVITRAAILARGEGTRMRRADPSAHLTPAQARAADEGLKGLMPFTGADGHAAPFLDFVLDDLARVGIDDVTFVVGPERPAVQEYYAGRSAAVGMRFSVQLHASGTAHAVLAAADEIGGAPFLVLNADNLYPPDALVVLAAATRASAVAFDRDALVAAGQFTTERVRAFAVLERRADGTLAAITEKPGANVDLSGARGQFVSMNCWAITSELVDACRRVPRSPRGEFELPHAVALAVAEGVLVDAPLVRAPVLDLSSRADVAFVQHALSGRARLRATGSAP